MKFRNTNWRKSRNTHFLEVLCGNCKIPILIYEKGGQGNLIKLQSHKIVESAVDLFTNEGHLHCPNCNEELANSGTYNDRLTYFVIRGKINSKKIDNYRI